MIKNQIKQVIRDRLFFDHWEYCCTIRVLEAGCLRGLNREFLDARINWINQDSWSNRQKLITSEYAETLHNLCDFFLEHKQKFKMCVERNHLRVYTNDVEFIELIEQRKEPQKIYLTQALALNERDVVLLKNPRYVYRTQLRIKGLSNDQKVTIKSMIENSRDEIKPSPGLNQYLTYLPVTKKSSYARIGTWKRGMYPPTNPFIDHSDLKWMTMISLMVPGIVVKTMPIRQRTK